MDEKKIREVAVLYIEMFKKAGVEPKSFPRDKRVSLKIRTFFKNKLLAHCHRMLEKTVGENGFLAEGKKEKVLRLLGFVQGVCWCLGFASINELKGHNMPDEEK